MTAAVLSCAIALQLLAQAQQNTDNKPQGDAIAQWVSTTVLAITAAFIAWQAWETKRAAKAAAASVDAINKQAGIMERQTAAAEKAAEAAKVSADASKQSSEIAATLHRPFVGLTRLALRNDQRDLAWDIVWTVKNSGTLPAMHVDAALEWKVGINSGSGGGPSSAEIFPQEEVESVAHLIFAQTVHSQLRLNDQILELHARIDYSAADGRQFRYTADAQWKREISAFAILNSQTQSK